MFRRMAIFLVLTMVFGPFMQVATAAGAATQGPTLAGDAAWGGTLQWQGEAAPGSQLIWAFFVQRGVDGQMVGEQFDVRHATHLQESGQLIGSARVDFLHPLAVDLYFWAEWRRPDGGVERAASRALPVTHRQLRVDFLLAEPARWVNGAREPLDMAPMLDGARVFVPIRHATEPFGAVLAWDQERMKATLARNGHTVELTVGNPMALVDRAPVPIDPQNAQVAPQLLAGRVLVPIRFVSEALGLDVEWVGRERRVLIQTPA